MADYMSNFASDRGRLTLLGRIFHTKIANNLKTDGQILMQFYTVMYFIYLVRYISLIKVKKIFDLDI